MSIDDTQNWMTLRRTHQVVCAGCETIISCLEQERDALKAELKDNKKANALFEKGVRQCAKDRDALKAKLGREKERADGNFDSFIRIRDHYSQSTKERDRFRALAEKLVDALKDVEAYYDEARYDCAICGNYMDPKGHTPGCVIPDVRKALSLYHEAMGGEK